MLRKQQYTFDDESRLTFVEYLRLRMLQPHFANARSVRNAIDRFKLRQASRLIRQGGRVPKEELMRLDTADISGSRVFRGGAEALEDHAEALEDHHD
jgi:hypothetical protein